MTYYPKPSIKIEVDHAGTTYELQDYNVKFDITREVNAIDNAVLTLTDENNEIYQGKLTHNDIIKIYATYKSLNDPPAITDLRFYGFVEDASPTLTGQGELLQVTCRSYFRCVNDLLCGQEYGSNSANDDIDTIKEILFDASDGIIPLWLNKLKGGSVNSGYTIDKSFIQAVAGTIPYLYFPYKPVKNCLDDALLLLQAGKGTTAGAHWIGLTEESPADTFTHYLLLTTVAAHFAGAPDVASKWSTYWNSTQAASTIVVKQDMITQAFNHLRPEANDILISGIFNRPASGDYWTNEPAGNSALWSSGVGVFTSDCDSIGAGAVGGVDDPIVGSTCLQIEPTNAPNVGYGFYPAGLDLGLNLTALSSPTSIPHLTWYEYQTDIAQFNFLVFLCTDNTTHCGGVADHYFSANWFYLTPVEDKWYRVSVPVGPYWARDPMMHEQGAPDDFYWSEIGTPNWNDINIIVFSAGDANNYDRCIDGLHFNGQIQRQAYLVVESLLTGDAASGQPDATVVDGTLFQLGQPVTISDDTPDTEQATILSIAGNVLTFTANLTNAYTVAQNAIVVRNTYYKSKHIRDTVAKDDSLEASDDSGTLGQLAYAELLRAARRPIQGTVILTSMQTGSAVDHCKILAGQIAHIHAAAYSGGYRINKDMRILQHKLTFDGQGLMSHLTLTDDIYQGLARSAVDEFNLIQKATDIQFQDRNRSSIKAGSVDLNLTILSKSYTFKDYF